MIKFIYKVKESLQSLIRTNIVDIVDYTELTGYVNIDASTDLRHTSLFLICDTKFIDNTIVYKSPLVIVAKNDYEALDLYHTITGVDTGGIMSILEDRCDGLKVEPVSD